MVSQLIWCSIGLESPLQISFGQCVGSLTFGDGYGDSGGVRFGDGYGDGDGDGVGDDSFAPADDEIMFGDGYGDGDGDGKSKSR